MAASATLALKAGVWFRRGRLLIISPVQQPSWLLSGRNPTYPVVQIPQATSMPAPPDSGSAFFASRSPVGRLRPVPTGNTGAGRPTSAPAADNGRQPPPIGRSSSYRPSSGGPLPSSSPAASPDERQRPMRSA